MLDEILNGAIETPREEVSNSNETITISREEFMKVAQEISISILEHDRERAKQNDKEDLGNMMCLAQLVTHIEYAVQMCRRLFGDDKEDEA